MTDILSDYYNFYMKYSKEYLTKIEKKQKHNEFMAWKNKEYDVLPTLGEIIVFMKDNETLKRDTVFLKKVLAIRVIEDMKANNLKSLLYTFSLVDKDNIGYTIDPIYLICEESNDFYTRAELADKVLKSDEKNKYALMYKYNLLLSYISNSIHELPFGVLYGMDGATIEELGEMKKDLLVFKCLSKKLEKNNDDDNFVDFCFVIYNAYGDYLVNRKLYQNFLNYLEKHKISDEYEKL